LFASATEAPLSWAAVATRILDLILSFACHQRCAGYYRQQYFAWLTVRTGWALKKSKNDRPYVLADIVEWSIRTILDYCQSKHGRSASVTAGDVTANHLPISTLSGRYMAASAAMEFNGPLDKEQFELLKKIGLIQLPRRPN
jgi:hypothetical protein